MIPMERLQLLIFLSMLVYTLLATISEVALYLNFISSLTRLNILVSPLKVKQLTPLVHPLPKM